VSQDRTSTEYNTAEGETGQQALDRYQPVKVGLLGADMGGAYRKIYPLAFERAKREGWLPRNVELIYREEHGLPTGSAQQAIANFKALVDEGCMVIAGAYSSDNAMYIAPLAKQYEIPLISWAGTDRLLNEWTFRLGNGDCGGDPALMVQWLVRKGYKRAGVISEISPNGEEYFMAFRRECMRWGLEIGGLELVEQTSPRMEYHLGNLKKAGCDALVHMGYGMHFVHNLFRPALEALKWDPPRITTTAFMFYLIGFSHFEGWVGVDQYCPDNPRAAEFLAEYKAAYNGEEPPLWPNAIPLLAYDTSMVIAEAMFRAPILTREGLRNGFERIRFVPSATGGPRTHMAGAPGDHNLFKGDWLLLSAIRNGKLEFESLYEPGR
jgi:ABC-type branched-subunit amino acid transport system substrate-binding protein